jgi:predicted Zn-dependent protease
MIKTSLLLRCLPLLMVVSLLAPAAPAAAQRTQDIGTQIEREYGVLSDDSRDGRKYNAMLDEVVSRVVRGVNVGNRESDFRLSSAKILGGRTQKGDQVVNAFALPDGRIYVTLGLMRLLDNSRYPEDELAFVVGHEVTHVAEHHAQSQTKKALPVSLAAILLGAVTKSRAIGQAAGLGAQAYSSSFSRKDEYRADKGGLMAMRQAGYDLNAAVDMLKRLQAQGGSRSKTITGWFGSHPLTENRVERIREMIADMDSGREPDDRSESQLRNEDARRRRR